MSKYLVVYGSTTGNTKELATIIAEGLTAKGHQVTVSDAADVSADGLLDGYDVTLFGCSSWGDDDIVLQDDFQELYDNFEKMNAKDKKVASFATGDSSFEHFCGAIDQIDARLEELGAIVVAGNLKIDGTASPNDSDITSWIEEVSKA